MISISEFALSLVPGPDAPAQARQEVARFLESDSFPTRFIDDAALMTSEVVTNSVRHVAHEAGDIIDLEAMTSPRGLRLQVQDVGPGYTWDREQTSDIEGWLPVSADRATGGWGLVIVDHAADRWGILRQPTRTWFELDLPVATA